MSKPLCCWWTILPRISIIKTEWRTIHETSTVMLHCNSVVTSQTQTFSALTCSFIRQLSMWHCSHLLLNAVLPRRWAPAVVDRYLLPARRSAANPLHAAAAVERWDRQTDSRPFRRPCSTYYASSVNNRPGGGDDSWASSQCLTMGISGTAELWSLPLPCVDVNTPYSLTHSQ